jgi:hypothetical protein
VCCRWGLDRLGDHGRLRAALQASRPMVLAALGSSNTVRGGCEQWQASKCSNKKYTAEDPRTGRPRGWLLQAWRRINDAWPHASSRLVNSALMATGPEGFARCTNAYVPAHGSHTVGPRAPTVSYPACTVPTDGSCTVGCRCQLMRTRC